MIHAHLPYAEVAVNTAVHGTFHYHVPPQWIDKIAVGSLVRVMFGTAQQPAIVVRLLDASPVGVTKPILGLYDATPIVTEEQIKISQWIADTYLCPLGLALWLFVPSGIVGQRDNRVRLITDVIPDNLSAQEQLAVDMLKKRRSMTSANLGGKLKVSEWHKIVGKLKQRGIVETESMLQKPTVRPKKIDVAVLNIAPEHLPYVQNKLGRPTHFTKLLEQVVRFCQDTSAVTTEDLLSLKGVGDKTLQQIWDTGVLIKTVEGIQPTDHAQQIIFQLKNGEQDQAVLRILAREGQAVDVSWLYAQSGANRDDLKRLENEGLITLGESETIRDPLQTIDFVPTTPPRLTQGQREAWQIIRPRLTQANPKPMLLHGVTGAGKTELYLRAIEHVIDHGRQAILLVPTIALTPQTIRRVLARLPLERVAIVHHELSQGEQYDTWRRARDGQIDLVVGTRSALFTPLNNIGLIVLDEEHDTSYKNIYVPYYHARETALQIANIHQSAVILGSATPDVETYYHAKQGFYDYLHLPERIMGHRVRIDEQVRQTKVGASYYVPQESDAVMIDLPPVKVVDMRDELKAGNISIFSRELVRNLRDVLERGEQAILFMNRRGTSTHVFCRDCGTVVTCPDCDMPLTYHHDIEQLVCHHCGYQTPQPQACSACGSKRIRYFGAGTQQIEQAFHQLFPEYVALRWDSDVGKGHDAILQRFINRSAQVLIGTQIIAKGLDLPLVTLVGVVSADVGLNLPDFRASERIFQTLAQVAGRAGRGVLGGRVILQTYHPEHQAIVSASQHDTLGYLEHEIKSRRQLGYPPFRRLLRIVIAHPKPEQAKNLAIEASRILRERLEALELQGTDLIGAVPCFYARLDRVYRWQILIRGSQPERVLDGLSIPAQWSIDVDPVDLL